MPDKPDMALASMGIYVFDTKFLFDQLRRDAADPNSSRDFGKDIIPYLVKHGKAVAHRFAQSCVRSDAEAEAYWRDVGTVDAYWEANIDLTDVVPALDLYDQRLADLDLCRDHAAGQVRARRGRPARHGGQLAGLGRLHRLRRRRCAARCCSPACASTPIASIEDAVVLPYVDVGRGARLTQGRGRPRRADPRRPGRRRGSRARRASASAAPRRASA